MEEFNKNIDQLMFPDEILRSVYWQERGCFHHKIVEQHDKIGISNEINRAASAILAADKVLFITGAGAGVDMGLPDFRSSNLFWEQLAHPDISRYEDSSNSKWFEMDPEFAWGLNFHQISMYRNASIHAGYDAMKKLSKLKGDDNFCFTSNIDGVLQRSGFNSNKVREIHGNIHRVQCIHYDCKNDMEIRDAWEETVEMKYNSTTFRAESELPHCPKCGSLSRPNIWYCTDRNYVPYSQSMEISNAYHRWLDDLEESGKTIAVIEVGAGLVIPSCRVEAEDVAERLKGALIRINPTDYMVPITGEQQQQRQLESYRAPENADGSVISAADTSKLTCAVGIPMGAAEGLVEILKRVQQLMLEREQSY